MDYRKLCLELFGTDDVDELTKIAQVHREKNPRKAGRKKKFTAEDVQRIRSLLENGMTMQEAAKRFNTSRQVIGKYLNEKPAEGYTLRMTYMYQQHPCTIIENKTKDMLHRAFGVVEHPTWDDFETFLKERCFPATRGNAKEILKQLQLTSYDPLQIVEKTRGRTAEDDMWLKFHYYPMERAVYGQNQS